MDRHQFDFDQFLFDQAQDAVTDVRTKLIDEAWFGRPAHSINRHDHPSQGWDRPEGHDDEDRLAAFFEARWSDEDTERNRDAPEQAPELDFDR